MIRLVVLGVFAIALTGCAGGYDRLEGPTVDLAGVDPVKHNKDWVNARSRSARLPTWARPGSSPTAWKAAATGSSHQGGDATHKAISPGVSNG
jgi:hypothetical protein